MISLILIVAAFVCAIAATANAPALPHLNWGWLSLALYFLSLILTRSMS